MIALLALFGAGVVSFLSPCSLPLAPVVVASAAGSSHRPVVGVAGFVVGFTAVFALLGSVAGAAGTVVRGLARPLDIVSGTVLILAGVAMAGVAPRLLASQHLGGPPVLARWLRRSWGPRGLRPVFLGAAFGVGWSPCSGPLLGAALTVAARDGSAQGALLLAGYAAGLGTPFVALALGAQSSEAIVRRLRAPSRMLRLGTATVLVGIGGLLVAGRWAAVTSALLSL